MALLIAQPVDASELERFTSSWMPETFVSMCNDLVWAVSGREYHSLPSLTARIYAPDAGIDAEWDIDIKEQGGAIPSPIVAPGWNVFQFKKRDLIAQDRSRIISKLKSELKGAVNKIAESSKRRPDRYLLFVNVDLKHDQLSALKQAILEGYSRAAETQVQIIGAQLLATFLNDNPHLRAAYFPPLAFKTWDEANKDHTSQKRFGSSVELIGRDEDVQRLRSFVNEPRVKVVLIAGPHDIGKSRLALEGTKHRRPGVVVALDPRSMSLADYRNLAASHHETLCIVEDPELDSIRNLINEILTIDNLKAIVTLPISNRAYIPSYVDERVQTIQLAPLSENHAMGLLNATGQPMDFWVKQWIIERAGGIPGILLAASQVGGKLRAGFGDLKEKVGSEFEERIQKELGTEKLKAARLFSLMTHVGVSGQYAHELQILCSAFRHEPHDALLALKDLVEAGVARRGGSFAEISIPMVAQHLAGKMLLGQYAEMFALFSKLDNSGKVRLLRRLGELPESPEVKKFWDEFFDRGGPLGDFDSALRVLYLLVFASDTMSKRTLCLLESGLSNSTREERLLIKGEARRELVYALERLLMCKETSSGAVRLLWLLAQAENEIWGNNATGVFSESFSALNPNISLPYSERLALLKSFACQDSSEDGKKLTIEALRGSLQRYWFPVMHFAGASPPQRLAFSPKEFNDYARGVVCIAFQLAEDENSKVSTEALRILPGLLLDLEERVDITYALEGMEKLVGWAMECRGDIPVSSLEDILKLMHDSLAKRTEEQKSQEDEFRGHLDKVRDLIQKLEEGDFEVRLKSAVGSWRTERQELERLAKEALRSREVLPDRLLEWLLSSQAVKSPHFFLHLGCQDHGKVFIHEIERLGENPSSGRFFASYWQGWAERDQEGAEARLDELTRLKAVSGEAIVEATGFMPASEKGIGRIVELIRFGEVDAGYAGRALAYPSWLRGIELSQFEKLLQAVAGPGHDLKHAEAAILMLYSWLYPERPLEGNLVEIAWRCLESDPELNQVGNEWQFEQLAGKLSKEDPDRGFALFEKLAAEIRGKRYDPWGIGRHHGLFDALHAIDRERLLKLILKLSRSGSEAYRIREVLDQKGDADLIISIAEESVENARIIAQFLNRRKDGESFWRIAFSLIKAYPDDELMKRNFGLDTGVFVGPLSEHYENLRKDIEERSKDPETPDAARPWLRGIADSLAKGIQSSIVWEYDIDVSGLQKHIQDKESPERIWAIGRVLKFATLEDIRRLLTPEDIAEALPHIDLPQKRRQALERAVKVWLE